MGTTTSIQNEWFARVNREAYVRIGLDHPRKPRRLRPRDQNNRESSTNGSTLSILMPATFG